MALGENKAEVASKLAEFRTLIQESNEISIIKEYSETERTDSYLLRFLRTAKFDLPKSLQRLEVYEKFVKEKKFKNMSPSKEMREFLQVGIVYCDPANRTMTGSQVIYVDGSQYHNIFDFDISVVEKSMWWLLESCSHFEQTQIHGFTMVADMAKFSLGLSNLKKAVAIEKVLLNMVQNVFPIRLDCFIVQHAGYVFDTLFAIVNLFLKEKMRKRVRLSGYNYQFAQSKIEPKYLCDFIPTGQYILKENRTVWVDRLAI